MILFVLLSCICGAFAQVILDGACDVKPGQAVGLVDVRRILGKWYELQRVPNADETGECSTMSFDIINPAIGYITTREEVDGALRERRGYIYKEDDSTGRFAVLYGALKLNYYVLATDYSNYALIYGCTDNADGTRNVWSWALSRSREYSPSAEHLQDLQAAVNRNPDLDQVTWTQPRQDGCSLT